MAKRPKKDFKIRSGFQTGVGSSSWLQQFSCTLICDCSRRLAWHHLNQSCRNENKLWEEGGVCLFLSSYWLLLTFSFLETEYFDWSQHLVEMLSCQIASFIHWWYMIYPLIYQLIINDNKWYKFDSWIENRKLIIVSIRRQELLLTCLM